MNDVYLSALAHQAWLAQQQGLGDAPIYHDRIAALEARITALEAALVKQRAVNEAWTALLEYIGTNRPPEDAIPAARALHAAVREALKTGVQNDISKA